MFRGFYTAVTTDEKCRCILQELQLKTCTVDNWINVIVHNPENVAVLNFTLSCGFTPDLNNSCLSELCQDPNITRSAPLIRRLVDFGYNQVNRKYRFHLRAKVISLRQTISFRLNARKLAIITIGAYRCKSQLNKPGFIDICKIIARLVWSARFRGSEWE
jgi:hypothetical protein